MHSWSVGKNATLSKKMSFCWDDLPPKRMMEECLNGLNGFWLGFPDLPKSRSVTAAASTNTRSWKSYRMMGLCPFSPGFWTSPYQQKMFGPHIFGTWKLMETAMCLVIWLVYPPKGKCIFSKTLHISACNLTQLLPGACPLRMPVHGVDACFFRMSSFASYFLYKLP